MTCFQANNESHIKVLLVIVPSKLSQREMLKFGEISEKLLQEELKEPDDHNGIAKSNAVAIRIAQIQDGFLLFNI